MPLIELSRVERTYVAEAARVAVLRGVDLAVEQGEVVAIVGPSGCGKSSLLHLLGGLDRPDGGVVRVDGLDLGRASEGELDQHRRSTVGFVFQAFHLDPRRSALENVLLPLVFSPLTSADGKPVDERARGLELLAQVGLAGEAERRVASLSGGQRQRVAVARALVRRPRILLADEPVGNLDAETGREIVALLSQLNRELGLTIVAVSHDHLMLEAATRTLSLRDGLLVEDAPSQVRRLHGSPSPQCDRSDAEAQP